MLHLIHPAFVHVSVAFLLVGGACEAAGLLARRAGLVRFGSTLVVAGTVSLVPTVVSGFLAQNSVEVPAPAAAVLQRHERLGLTILGVFLVALLWRAWGRGTLPDAQRPLYAGWLLLGVALVAWEAFLGGEMVYRFGVGVARP